MPEFYSEDSDESGGARSVWSGTVAFGLVSLPVTLFTANRAPRISLRLLDEDGTPLQRRFVCSEDETPLDRDNIVRGFEVDKTRYIPITDEELDALAPNKSREIDLRRFVPLKDIDPMYFKRAYFLIPDEGASKAYRLLAKSMEESGRAGIATFVMRGKEYLLAIIAERGILRAESLRFHDELRRPADLALPAIGKADRDQVNSIIAVIKDLSANTLNQQQLTDQWSHQLLKLIEHKLQTDKDVLHAPDIEVEDEEAPIVDLMEVLKQSLASKAAAEDKTKRPERGKTMKQHSARASDKIAELELGADKSSKAALYELARELDIHGRSQMSKQDLLHAIQRAR